MKLNRLFTVLLTSACCLFAGCVKELPNDHLQNLQLSKTYLSIDQNGGGAELVITATESWKFVIDENWPNVITFKKDANDKTIKAKHDEWGNLINDEADFDKSVPSWLSVSALSGESGETKLTFKAEETAGGREQKLAIICGTSKQYLIVRQGSMAAVTWTCNEVLTKAAVGASYTIENAVVTSLGNYEKYGAFYVTDDSNPAKDVQIYGSTSASIAKYPNLEPGDIVTFTGTWSSYGNFENAEISKLTKSLLKLITESATYAKGGDEFKVTIAYKGRNVDYSIPEEYKDWIQVTGISSKEGIPTKLEQNPADTAFVAVKILPNPGSKRNGSILFSSATGAEKESKTEIAYEFTQDGDIIDATAAEINAAVDGPTLYRYTGCITKDTGNDYGNIYVDDHTGSVYVYGVLNEAGESKKWKEMGIKECDIVTLIAPKTSYKESPQLKNATVEKHIPVTHISINDFIGKEDKTDVYYRLSGTISGIKDGDQYGNFNITDETGTVYVYGLLKGWGGEKKHFQELGLKNGDKVTLVGTHSSYNGNVQVGNAFFVSMEEGAVDPGVDAVLESIAWTGYTTSYTVNDTFKKDGKVTATYSDGATADVTADATFSSPDMTTAGEKTITVTYKGKETTGTITVNEAGGGDEPAAKYVKVSAAPTDWTGKYLIVFGTEAHATISGKDLKKTADVTISAGTIASETNVDAAAVTIAKNEAGDKYVMTLPSGSYFGMAHNSCASSASPFALEFEYTEGGIKISGDVAGKTGKYYLYSNKNNGDFYRCYVDKTGSSGYSLPELYKYTDK